MIISDFTNLADLLDWRQSTQGQKEAFEFITGDNETGDIITYAELADKALQVSAALIAKTVEPGDRVMVVLTPGLDLIANFMGVIYAGASVTLAAPPTNGKQLESFLAIAEDLMPKAVITSSNLLEKLTAQIGVDALPDSLAILTIEDILHEPNRKRVAEIDPENTVLIQYTSGSIGKPKGVMISHKNIMHNSMIIQQSFFHTSKSRGLIWLPPYHDMGLIGGIIQPIYAGFLTTLMSPRTFVQRPFRWLNLIGKKKVTTSGGPDFAYDLCIKRISAEERAQLDLSSWQVAFNGAEPIKASVLKRFTETFAPADFTIAKFFPCYGLAESTLYVTGINKLESPVILKANQAALLENRFEPEEEGPHLELVSCGVTYYDATMKIVDPETRQICRHREVGEIWVASNSNGQGYFNKPVETAETFAAQTEPSDGLTYMRTGDLGFTHRSQLFVTGRLKNMIIVNGKNHYPQDIEQTALETHSGLAPGKSAAFGVTTETGEKLVLVQEVKRKAMKEIDSKALINEIMTRVFDRHDIPISTILLMEPGGVPITANGKVRRAVCKKQYMANELIAWASWNEPERPIEALPEAPTPALAKPKSTREKPQSHLWELVTQGGEKAFEAIKDHILDNIAKEVAIDKEEIDADMHFGLYGLDSVSAVQLITLLEDELDNRVEIDPTVLWDYPNLNAISTYLTEFLSEETKAFS